jgi:NAD(P)-dependent dehydrogenase (short-subunit alcohol dehydrogenase family)
MLSDTTAFVTGASQGIGREIAITLAEHGASVGLAARSEGIYETAELMGDYDRALPVETDVTDETMVRDAIAKTVDAFGGLDCVVNNAGIAGPTKPIQSLSIEEWQQVQDVNVLGTVLCTKHAVPYLEDSDRASVIAIASISAKSAHPYRVPYTASNAAQIAIMRAVAYELGDAGVTANTICPGAVEGDRIQRVWEARAAQTDETVESIRQEREEELPTGEIVQPRDIGEMVAYLAGPHARHITAQDININSGSTVY